MRHDEARDRRQSARGMIAGRARLRPRLRPTLVTLENRRLMSVFQVTNDSVDSANTTGTLRWAVAQANAASSATEIEIELGASSATIALTSGQLTLTNTFFSTTIYDGPGEGAVTISGNNASRVFEIDSGVTASISGLTISGGSTTGNGNSTLEGGAIFNSGTLTVTQSTVSGSLTAGNGNDTLEGGAIFNSGTLTVTQSTVSGSLVCGNGNDTLEGGAIFNGYMMTVIQSTVSGSLRSGNGNDILEGGGIFNSFCLAVSQSTVSGVFASGHGHDGVLEGGGIFNRYMLTVEASTVSGTLRSGDGFDDVLEGGGIFNLYKLTVKASTVSGTLRSGDGFDDVLEGGGIFNDYMLTVTGSTLSGNSLISGGGNDDVLEGGGIFNHYMLTVTGSTLSGNSLVSGNGNDTLRGGGIFNAGILTVSQSTVSSSSLMSGQGEGDVVRGGGVFNSGTLTFYNSTVADNEASGTTGEGGGLYISSGTLSLYNVTVALNSAGGGVYQAGGTVNAYNSLFADNGYTGASGQAGADYSNSASGAGAAVAYNSVFGSQPVGVINGGGPFVGNPGLSSSGLQPNGGPTQTIAIVAGSDAIGNGLNGTDGVFLFTDQRGYVPTASAWDIGAYQSSGIPAPAPTATDSAPNVSVSQYGEMTYSFTVTYEGAAGITPSSLAGAVVTVDPPGGLGGPITANVITTVANGPTDPWGDAQSFTVTYQITPPHGSWVSADNGTYSVVLGGSPVSDTGGKTIPTGTLGTFQVETGRIAITKYGLIRNPRTGLWSGTIKLTNTGDATFSGPIFVLFHLPAGTVLENATGTYNGEPYLEVNIGSLAVGATIGTTAIFNKNVAPASYSTSYYLVSQGS
jgi:hypothetical protein